ASINDQQNKPSYKVDCPWHINISKKSKDIYMVTTFVNEHKGYTLNSQTVYLLSQFRKLTKEILDDIQFWISA
ncbi:948_t:CDS:1, partial [Cetraspora pellucida]